jgi:hypothetical protein
LHHERRSGLNAGRPKIDEPRLEVAQAPHR